MMADNPEPAEQPPSDPSLLASPGGKLRAAGCLAFPCTAVAVMIAITAHTCIPGLRWSVWTSAVVGIAGLGAATLIALSADASRFDEDRMTEWVCYAVQIAWLVMWTCFFAAGFGGVGVPLWLAIPLGAVVALLVYVLLLVGGGGNLIESTTQITILVLLVAILFPLFAAARQKARMADARRRHSATHQAPSASGRDANGGAAMPARKSQPTGAPDQ